MKQFISLLLVVLMLFCFAGCEGGVPSNTEPPKAPFSIPGTLSAENFDLTIVSVQICDTVNINSGIDVVIEPDDGKQFLVLCIDAKNTSDEIRNLGNFFAYADGVTVLPHNVLGKLGDRVIFVGGVHPGKTICTYILYQVPTDVKEFELAYQDSFTGSISKSIVINCSDIK